LTSRSSVAVNRPDTRTRSLLWAYSARRSIMSRASQTPSRNSGLAGPPDGQTGLIDKDATAENLCRVFTATSPTLVDFPLRQVNGRTRSSKGQGKGPRPARRSAERATGGTRRHQPIRRSSFGHARPHPRLPHLVGPRVNTGFIGGIGSAAQFAFGANCFPGGVAYWARKRAATSGWPSSRSRICSGCRISRIVVIVAGDSDYIRAGRSAGKRWPLRGGRRGRRAWSQGAGGGLWGTNLVILDAACRVRYTSRPPRMAAARKSGRTTRAPPAPIPQPAATAMLIPPRADFGDGEGTTSTGCTKSAVMSQIEAMDPSVQRKVLGFQVFQRDFLRSRTTLVEIDGEFTGPRMVRLRGVGEGKSRKTPWVARVNGKEIFACRGRCGPDSGCLRCQWASRRDFTARAGRPAPHASNCGPRGRGWRASGP